MRRKLLGVAALIGLVAVVSVAYASGGRGHSLASNCSTPQPNRVLHVVNLTTTYKCAVASTIVRRVLGPKGCGLSYNDGFTVATCRFLITGHTWRCASIANPNWAQRKESYFDVGCTSYRIYATTHFDLKGYTT